eukprot:TRINITY_DN2504_c0_g1_i2.p2 TRINITY_DN2504_c0_g1~~TRINITY_DN2504_c0_g1_i2.p2  ORF type:complete len:173 (+),score=61.32 TRINITY_DN2504_c0_g1_i2:424-942(+)
MIVDNTCMQMVSRPQQFDVMILPNLYGNIVTNIAAGICGGPGLFPGGNIGENGAVFEQGARHSGLDIAGKNKANPTGQILGGVMMLRYLQLTKHADAIENAVMRLLEGNKARTGRRWGVCHDDRLHQGHHLPLGMRGGGRACCSGSPVRNPDALFGLLVGYVVGVGAGCHSE